MQQSPSGNSLAPQPFEQKDNADKITYRFVLDHHFSRDILGYASMSRGFKSGGYNLTAPTIVSNGVTVPAPVIKPEVLDAYEVGLKTELFDRKLRLNLAAYYYDYTNMQVTIVGQASSLTLNAAAAHIKGIDADFQYPFKTTARVVA